MLFLFNATMPNISVRKFAGEVEAATGFNLFKYINVDSEYTGFNISENIPGVDLEPHIETITNIAANHTYDPDTESENKQLPSMSELFVFSR